MADEAAEFWEAFERETGEKVVARSIGEQYEGPSDPGVWGILVLTDKSLRFKHMPSDNWLVALFRGPSARKGEKKLPDDVVIRRESLIAVETPKRGLFQRLFGPAFPRFRVVCRGEGEELVFIFSSDPGSGLLEALKAAVPAS